MFNRERTKEVFGYDIDITKKRRTREEILKAPKVEKKGKLQVVDNCPSCGKEKHVQLKQSLKNKPCYKCFHNTPEMMEAKRNQIRSYSEETRKKMRENHWSKKGVPSAFKGKKHTEEVRERIRKSTIDQNNKRKLELGEKEYAIKMACTARKIDRSQFNGFITPENTKIRQSAEGKAWTYDVLSKANYACEKCHKRGGTLNAHHINSFGSFPDQRFDVNNGACLCQSCHADFHYKYGKGDNTEEQYNDFIRGKNDVRQVVYMLIGAPSSGKSWVAEQVSDKFDYVSYDNNRKKDHINLLLRRSDKPKLYDAVFKISTNIKRHSDKFDFKIVCIYESEEVLRERMRKRGGKWTDTVLNRNEQVKKRYEKYGGFIGTSGEVLEYLKNLEV